MTNEQAQKVLDELQDVRPEKLNSEAKRLFEAIMKIDDERDKIKQEYDRDTHMLQNQLDLANAKNIEKDKIIDLMAEQLAGLAIFDIEKDEPLILGDKEEVKQYFKEKVEDRV